MNDQGKITRVKYLKNRLEEIKREEGLLETEKGIIAIELKQIEDPGFSGWVK